MFYKNYFGKLIWALVLAFVLRLGVGAAERSLLQQGIAEEVLRFHVLANSDSETDQNVKLKVRDAVLQWINRKLTEEKISDYKLGNDKVAVMDFAIEHLEELKQEADRVLEAEGASYGAEAEVTLCYFPERTYGDCTFPAGWYDALRIRLGEARGHNWWCVLYPKLCFSDALHAVTEEKQLQKLEEVLTVEEYESLFEQPGKWKISFRWIRE